MTKESIINDLKIKKANYEKQRKELEGQPSEEIYETIYELDTRIDEINKIIDEIDCNL